MERRHLASLGAAALLVLCGIVQMVLFFVSDPDLLALCLQETAGTIEPAQSPVNLRLAILSPAGEETVVVDKDTGKEIRLVEQAVRARFENNSQYIILDRELQEDTLNEHADIARRPKSDAEAVAAGKKLGVEAVLWCDAKAHHQTAEKAEVELAWGLVKVWSGDKVNGEHMAGGSDSRSMAKGFFALDRYRAKIDATSALFRVFLWIVSLLVLPAALAPVNEFVLGMRTNAAAAALLSGYAVLDFVLMLLLNGFRLFSVFWLIAALVALAAGALYTLAVLNALSEG